MPIDQKRNRVVFQKLYGQLEKLSTKPAPQNVHKFRTYGRRVEVVLDELVANPNRNTKKVLKLLARLRKKAGQIRDLDVEIDSLRNLKVLEPRGHKSQLLRALAEERAGREKKLARAFDKKSARDLRKRLKRVVNEVEIPQGADPLAIAKRQLGELGRDHAPLTEKTLHQYRIVGKRARYLSELDGNNPEAQQLVEHLKRMQDVLGDWHDWLKLTEKAEELFGGVQDSALVAALRNVTRAKFRQSVDILVETRQTLSKRKLGSVSSPPERKLPVHEATPRDAVA